MTETAEGLLERNKRDTGAGVVVLYPIAREAVQLKEKEVLQKMLKRIGQGMTREEIIKTVTSGAIRGVVLDEMELKLKLEQARRERDEYWANKIIGCWERFPSVHDERHFSVFREIVAEAQKVKKQ